MTPTSPLFFLLSAVPMSALGSSSTSYPLTPRQWDTGDVSISSGERGPWNISAEAWGGLMSNPDVEKTFPIDGFNIFNSNEMDSIDGWTISLSVRTDMPAGDLLDVDEPSANFSGSLLRLNPPESLVEAGLDGADDDGDVFLIRSHRWRICSSFFNFHPLANRTAVRNDDGSCRSVLSEACIRAIERAHDSDRFDRDRCVVPSMPEECSFTGAGTVQSVSGAYRQWGDRIELDEGDSEDVDWLQGSELRSVATDGWPRGDDDAQNIDMVTRYTDFVIISWVYSGDDDSSNDSGVRVSNSLVCPKPLASGNDDGNGDETDDDDDNGAEGTLSVSLAAFVLSLSLALLAVV